MLLLTQTSIAQSGYLKGKVTDKKSGESLPGANIFTVQDKTVGVASDIQGNYLLELPVGEHLMICSFTGMISDTFRVNIQANSTLVYHISLLEESKILDVVVIAAGKFEQNIEDLTVSMEVIKPRLVENRNTTSIETALEQTPGLTILDQEPQIRGGSGFTFGVGSRVAIVVDGMPLLSGDAGRPEWGFIPVENLEQIEVIKGASSVLYGSSALSGVINIRTSYPKLKPETKINFTSGVYSSPKNTAAKWWDDTPLYGGISFFHSRIIKKNLDLVVGGNYFYDHGYIGPPLITDPLVIDTLTNFTDDQIKKYRGRINFNLRYRSEKIKGLSYGVNGNAMIAKTNFALAWLNDSSGIYRGYPGAISLQDQVIFYVDPFVEYYKDKDVKHSLRTRFFYNDNKITNNQSNQSTLLFGEYQLQKKFSFIPEFNFTAGLVSTLAQSNAVLYAGSGSTDNQVVNIAGYSQIDKKFWKSITLSAGVRMEYFKMNDLQSIVKPIFRAGMNIRVMKATWLRYSYGQGFRFPTITERFILTNVGTFGVFPNPDLQAETSTSFEIGFKQAFKFGKVMGYLDFAGFHQEYENTIEYLFGLWDASVAPVGFKFLNTGNTRVRGMDISLVMKAEIKKDIDFTIMGGYTYVLPVSLNPNEIYTYDNAPGGPRPMSYSATSMDTTDYILKYRFQHTAKGDFDLRIKRVTLGYSGRFYSSMRNIDKAFQELEVLTQFAPAFSDIFITEYWKTHNKGNFIQDARVGFIINEQIRVSIIVNNIANKEYMLRPMKIESPRTIAIQYLHKF